MRHCYRCVRYLPSLGDQHGIVLVAVLIVMVVLMGLGTTALIGGYTNLLTSTNLRLATRARATAEANVSEALFRLTLQPAQAAAIVPNMQDPDWQVDIEFTEGDTDTSDYDVSTIQKAVDWPTEEFRPDEAVTLEFKKDTDGNVIFYNRIIPAPNPPYLKFELPMDELGATLPLGLSLNFLSPVITLVEDTVYQLLCDEAVGLLGGLGGPVEEVGDVVGDSLGVCPAALDLADAGYPVIQMRTTGLDARGARRTFLAEAVRTVMFTPVAPLSAGGNINLGNVGFIDGVNHHHGIQLGSGGIYGDDDNETTHQFGIVAPLLRLIRDSPDDSNLWLPSCAVLCALEPLWHGIANGSLLVDLALPLYTSFPRPFNRQISATNATPAWVGVARLESAMTSALTGIVGLPPHLSTELGIWTEFNLGYTAAIALSATSTISNGPTPPTGYNDVWNRGVFSWRINNRSTTLVGDSGKFPGAVTLVDQIPAENTLKHCGPAVVGNPPPLVCRPAVLATFPTFQSYIGLDDVTFQELLASPDTKGTDLGATTPPLGFTYLNGNYTMNTAANPTSNDFGLMYASGNLNVSSGTHTFKGLIFVDGNLRVEGGAHLIVLGAVMVRGTVTQTGGGRMMLLYSREATNRGVQAARPWRISSWADTALQDASGH